MIEENFSDEYTKQLNGQIKLYKESAEISYKNTSNDYLIYLGKIEALEYAKNLYLVSKSIGII